MFAPRLATIDFAACRWHGSPLPLVPPFAASKLSSLRKKSSALFHHAGSRSFAANGANGIFLRSRAAEDSRFVRRRCVVVQTVADKLGIDAFLLLRFFFCVSKDCSFYCTWRLYFTRANQRNALVQSPSHGRSSLISVTFDATTSVCILYARMYNMRVYFMPY